MNRIDSIPALNWSDHSGQEIERTGQELLDQSDFAWRIGNVAICGLIYSSFTSPPWMWFALTKDVTMRDLIDFRRLARLIPRGTCVGIRDGYILGVRFAKFYGFVDASYPTTHDGVTYNLYRRA